MYCLDTYALVEIVMGNDKYTKYLDKDFVVPSIILAEFYGVMHKKYDEKTADFLTRKFLPFSVDVETKHFIDAMKYRIKHAKEKLSFYDCVGYCLSLGLKYIFLTGDKAFKDRKGVLYVK